MTLTANDLEFMRLAGAAHESGLRQMRLRKLNDANAHRHTFKTLLEATCTDCCCKTCICDDVADMNGSDLEGEQGCGCNGAGCYQCKGKGSR